MRKLLFIIICFLTLHTTCFAASNYAKPYVSWNDANGNNIYTGQYYVDTTQLTPLANTYAGSYQQYYLFFHIDPMNRSNLPLDYEITNINDMYRYLDSLTDGYFSFCTTSNSIDFDLVGNNHIPAGRPRIVYTDQTCLFNAPEAPAGYIEGYVGYVFFKIKDINISTLEIGEYAYIDFNAFLYTANDILFSPLGYAELTNYDQYDSYYFAYKDNGLNSNAVLDELEQVSEYVTYTYDQNGVIINKIEDPTVNTGPYAEFFNKFVDSDPGSISSIVTSPLKLINSFRNQCQPLSLKVFDKNISIPCGTTLFWDRPDVQNFRDFFNILVGGLVIYKLLTKVFKSIENMKDPDNSNVEVMSL